ncbi:hypothetical protein B566_EDAN004199 [Ephemera danica]|nr:hypothetical protein B566_EDAN004199 [Ephemera danica]
MQFFSFFAWKETTMSLNFSALSKCTISRLFSFKNNRIKRSCVVPLFIRTKTHVNSANLDFSYLCNPANTAEIEENIVKRDSNGNIKLVQDLYKIYESSRNEKDWEELMSEGLKIPNKTLVHRDENEVLQVVGDPPQEGRRYLEFSEVCRRHGWCRTDHLGNVAGHRAYYLLGELAELEQALIRLAVTTLRVRGFQLVSVPDILPASDIESCGMPTRGERTQVYRLDERHGKDLCLSGTAEMALAARLANSRLSQSSLPLRLAAFTKVEMFGVTLGGTFEHSQALQNELVKLQLQFFSSLGLHFRVLDMASNELGNPAVRKLDLEAWLPGRQMWGELCSCSDCGDFQSRRHDMRLEDSSSFVHTVNGTACAVPRTLMALVETHQNEDGTVTLPAPLRDLMSRDVLGRSPLVMPDMRPLRSKDLRAK